MSPTELLQLIIVIALAYVAFRIGAVLMKVLLGLVAIAVLVWLVTGLLGPTDAATLSTWRTIAG